MVKFLEKLEFLLEQTQGIGYGGSSIKKEISSLSKFIPNGKIFVDVGGNKGLYSEELLRIFNPDEVHIFEPSVTNVEILKSKFLDNPKIFINPLGLSNKESNSILYSNESGSGLGSLTKRRLDHFGLDFSVEEDVKLIRFDEYWRSNSKLIDLMKIDVEGHELEVLDGIGDFIESIRIIQFEFGGCNIDTRTYFQDYWYFFQKNNFKIFRITPIGSFEVVSYKERYERFMTTNYFCVNENLK